MPTHGAYRDGWIIRSSIEASERITRVPGHHVLPDAEPQPKLPLWTKARLMVAGVSHAFAIVSEFAGE